MIPAPVTARSASAGVLPSSITRKTDKGFVNTKAQGDCIITFRKTTMSEKSGTSNIISLPKGGGAQHGMREKFSPDLHTGTGNFTRFQSPSLQVAMASNLRLNLADTGTGSGNGPFGPGWNLSIPGVSRNTSKGVPRYDETRMCSCFRARKTRSRWKITRSTAIVPRTEGLFAARFIYYRDATNNYWKVGARTG